VIGKSGDAQQLVLLVFFITMLANFIEYLKKKLAVEFVFHNQSFIVTCLFVHALTQFGFTFNDILMI
jgi:hypothetical protein